MGIQHCSTSVCILLIAYVLIINAQTTITIQTNYGAIEGLITPESNAFYGIPYAQPPIGPNRFQNPLPAKPWSPSTLQALAFQPACPQTCTLPPDSCPQQTSEDCLYLNVWAPQNVVFSNGKVTSPLVPVYVFFPGGDYAWSGASVPLHEGRFLANTTQCVVVTVAYRLGALGFLATGDGFQGNYALYDQWLALDWVQKNIATFGGDATQITIGGESAGAFSVTIHLTSPIIQNSNYFQQAIMESATFGIPIRDVDQTQVVGATFAYFLGCDITDTNCFLEKSVNEIVAAENLTISGIVPWPNTFQSGYIFSPIVGTKEVPLQPIEAFLTGDSLPIPVIMGTNSQEGYMFVYLLFDSPMDVLEYKALVLAIFGFNAFKILESYPCTNSTDCRPTLAMITTHFVFSCPTRAAARAQGKLNDNIYLYYFNHVSSFGGWGPNYPFCVDAVCHGAELPYVFGVVPFLGYSWTSAEQQLSQNMMQLWGDFVNVGDFTNIWPLYNATDSESIALDVGPLQIQSDFLDDLCDMWDEVGYSTSSNFLSNIVKMSNKAVVSTQSTGAPSCSVFQSNSNNRE
eukprot:TRINITY_DN614_c0_g1_i1.p1 TRINITY_DN614_c0_g1~~TRINITY_DN614_c0_g1_i1.p1  ORF type:complete len:572 (-),score=112.96 TRINITY_DN614_c0_g1_i1:633-2348(-)